MTGKLAALAMLLLPLLVLGRILMLRARGAQALQFGKIDRTDFLIPPFALFYLYIVLGAALGWPLPSRARLFQLPGLDWVGVALCYAGVALLLATLVSFGRSFRVGIDVEHPDALITRGVFALSRNPTYVAFAAVLLGEFLVFPNAVLLAYLLGGLALLHRQVLREEDFMRAHYAAAFTAYCHRVRRYL